MSRKMRSLGWLLAAWALPCVVPGAVNAQVPGAVQATLLHRGTDGFVHAVPLQPGFIITLTVPTTGVMKPLLQTQVIDHGPRQDAAALPRNVASTLRSRRLQDEFLAGVAVDGDRLYAVTATRILQLDDAAASAAAQPAASGDQSAQGAARAGRQRPGRAGGRAPEPRHGGPPAAPGGTTSAVSAAPRLKLVGHRFHLHAFSLKDGTPLLGDGHELPLVSEDEKATKAPDTTHVRETLSRGLLQIVPDGVRCQGTTIIFTGNDVKSLDVRGKQFTPPPGFFESTRRDPDIGRF